MLQFECVAGSQIQVVADLLGDDDPPRLIDGELHNALFTMPFGMADGVYRAG